MGFHSNPLHFGVLVRWAGWGWRHRAVISAVSAVSTVGVVGAVSMVHLRAGRRGADVLECGGVCAGSGGVCLRLSSVRSRGGDGAEGERARGVKFQTIGGESPDNDERGGKDGGGSVRLGRGEVCGWG